jgi:pyridoxamine 5'-phosphate oxidase
MNLHLESLRRDYAERPLDEAALGDDPLDALARWIADASSAGAIEPNAMCLATVGASGRPSARMVLLRGLDAHGLVFYTSYLSRKGRELDTHPHAAATFWWPEIVRQVRIEGIALRLSDEESDAYFATRPRGHRLSAWASEQSEPVESRAVLEARLEHFAERFAGDEEIPRPHSWGGYRIVPDRIEFWQGRANRLHDRLLFERDGARWHIIRLQP